MKQMSYILLMILALSEMESHASTSTVIGDISCEQWLDRRTKDADVDSYTSWLEGYLSGANAMYDDLLSKSFLNSTKKISVVDWTDAYCQKYPKSMAHDSANVLIKILEKDMPYF